MYNKNFNEINIHTIFFLFIFLQKDNQKHPIPSCPKKAAHPLKTPSPSCPQPKLGLGAAWTWCFQLGMGICGWAAFLGQLGMGCFWLSFCIKINRKKIVWMFISLKFLLYMYKNIKNKKAKNNSLKKQQSEKHLSSFFAREIWSVVNFLFEVIW